MTHATSHTALAEQLIAARRDGARVDPTFPLTDAAAAYQVQALVAEQCGPVGAFKTARKPGEPVIMAPILAADVFRSPADFEPNRFNLIGIELEVGFIVQAPLPPVDAPDFEALARRAIAAVPVIEIVDTRLSDFQPAGALLRLADNQLNGGLLVGAPVRDWQDLDLGTPRARLQLGEEVVLEGPANVPGGDAFAAFCALARLVGDHCGGLQVGQVVITGSLNGMPFIEPGCHVLGDIAGLGSVSAHFRA